MAIRPNRAVALLTLTSALVVGGALTTARVPGVGPQAVPSDPSSGPTAAVPPPSSPAASPTGRSVPPSVAPSASLPPPIDGWTLIFHDTFDQPVASGDFPAVVRDRWDAYPSPWRDTSGRGMYAPEIVSMHDSMMDIHLRTVDGVAQVAAPMPVLPVGDGKHQLYGRYEVRFRADALPGFKTAWLLWPASGVWPRDGEIDFPEGALDGSFSAFLHHQGAADGGDQAIFPADATYDRWHTAVIEWGPGVCEFLLDGRSIGRSTVRVPNTPMRWVLQTETALRGPGPAPDVEGHVLVDWVTVWSHDG